MNTKKILSRAAASKAASWSKHAGQAWRKTSPTAAAIGGVGLGATLTGGLAGLAVKMYEMGKQDALTDRKKFTPRYRSYQRKQDSVDRSLADESKQYLDPEVRSGKYRLAGDHYRRLVAHNAQQTPQGRKWLKKTKWPVTSEPIDFAFWRQKKVVK